MTLKSIVNADERKQELELALAEQKWSLVPPQWRVWPGPHDSAFQFIARTSPPWGR